MKTHKFLMIAIIGAVALTACTGNAVENVEEDMVFTEEEVMEQPAEEGMDFTEEETKDMPPNEGFDFTADEAADEAAGDAADEGEEMVFDDDEVEPVPDPPDVVLPPEGTGIWEVIHDAGSLICPNLNIPIEASPAENVSILVGADADTLVASGFDGEPEIYFFLFDSGPGGSLYKGFYTPPGASEEIKYEIFFTNISDPTTADYLMGTISAEEQGCKISRSFYGNRLN